MRSRVVLGVAVALVAVFIGSLISTPTRPTAASRPGGAPPAAPGLPPQEGQPPVPQPPVTLPVPTDELSDSPSPTLSPGRKVAKVPPPVSPTPTPTTGYGGYPLPTPSVGGGELDDDLDDDLGDDLDYVDDGDDDGKKPKKPKKLIFAKLNFFAWFIALLSRGD